MVPISHDQIDATVDAAPQITAGPHLVFLYPQLKKLTGAQRLILMLAKWTTRLGGRATLVTHRLTPEVRAALDPAVALIETGQRIDRFGQHYLDAALEYLAAPALRAAIPADADGLVFFGPPSLPALWAATHRDGLRAEFDGLGVAELAEELLTIATAGLEAQGEPDAVRYLDALRQRRDDATTYGDVLRECEY